jgi:hypothetical protein
MFVQHRRAESASGQQSSTGTPTLRTRSQLPTGFHSQPSLSVSFAKSQLALETTIEIDKNVRRCATELGDTELPAKLSAGNMVAIEAKYHHIVCMP